MNIPFVQLYKKVDGELIFIQDFQWAAEMEIYKAEHPGFDYEVHTITFPIVPPPVVPIL